MVAKTAANQRPTAEYATTDHRSVSSIQNGRIMPFTFASNVAHLAAQGKELWTKSSAKKRWSKSCN